MMSGEALALQMQALNPGGLADYRFDASHTPTTRGGACTGGTAGCPPAFCDEVGDISTTVPPKPLCPYAGTGITFSLTYSDTPTPSIWTLPPVTGDLSGCVGNQLDSLNHLPEGPTCVITRAVDKAGNVQVSYPLHICIDRGGGKCTAFAPNALDCTGVFDKVQQKIVAGTCTAPPVPSAGNSFNPNPGTFRTDGTEVRFYAN
jgi:hypothetical protein